MEIEPHVLLISELDKFAWQALHTGRLIPEEKFYQVEQEFGWSRSHKLSNLVKICRIIWQQRNVWWNLVL
jgi:hypothetical protein